MELRSTTASNGMALLGIGNNQVGHVLSDGCGIAATGYRTGVYARANASGNEYQAGGRFSIGSGGWCNIACRDYDGNEWKAYGTGACGTIMPTSQRSVGLVAVESPEAWFEDFGDGKLVAGRGHIELDPLFLETVTIDPQNPMKVYVQLTSGKPMGLVVEKGLTGFDVVAEDSGSEATFDYIVVAKWKGWEGVRFPNAPAPPSDLEAAMLE
jgi:hypothetical protein